MPTVFPRKPFSNSEPAEAEAYVEEHPEQADKKINEVAGLAEPDSDHQHDEQIDRAVDAAERRVDHDRDQQED